MLDEGSRNQLLDTKRLGIKDRFGQKLLVDDIEIQDDWEVLVVYQGYFNSIGCKRLYYKDPEINTKDKYHTPYRTYMLPVGGIENTIVTQCVDFDRIFLKIVGTEDDIEMIRRQVRKDFSLEGDLTDQEIIEANRRDLEKHKRIVTVECKFNEREEKLDKHGQVITNLDHYDNFFYEIKGTTEEIVYLIKNAQRNIEWIEEKIIMLEDLLEYHLMKLDRPKAIRAIGSMSNKDLGWIEKKTWKEVQKDIDTICFETEKSISEIWAAWRYLKVWDIEDSLQELNSELDKLLETEEDFEFEE